MSTIETLAFRAPERADEAAIARIDGEGLATGHATFRDKPHDWASFQASFCSGRAIALIAETGDEVVAWAGVSPASPRPVYRGIGEVSIYVSKAAQGRGVGGALLGAFIARSEQQGFWTLTAQIFPENRTSIALHRRCGFEILGHRKRLGRMTYGPLKDQWRDVIFLERRSERAGLD